ncbi:MAG: triacylglycerol lipase [Myxococcota bacterium]|jgi:triacylglycerol lipase
MISWLLCMGVAFATPGFDATAPAARLTGAETFTSDGVIKLWSAIERLEDPDRTLLSPEAYNSATEWPENINYAPFIRQSFGSARPGSHSALLHMGLSETVTSGTPILMVHGAGDNGSRSFVTMATRLDRSGRPVYALTFAHPHGDVFRQAELIADAIARIRHRTGAAQVDVVAHSKGGTAAAIYLSNAANTDWGRDDYASVGTVYRGDVRRAVFIATPLAGTDTTYRWTANNYAALDSDTALTPASWSTYYPSGSASWWNSVDLSEQDHLSADGDLFPGQRQILARQPYTLPGENPTLGAYALQQDWYTTYEGGTGFFSESSGIDAAIADGGDVIARISAAGVDPDVELFILAGRSPLLSNGLDWVTALYEDAYADEIGVSADTWAEFVGSLVGDGLLGEGLSTAEVTGIARGDLILGEITGESDGVVFTTSATETDALTARGARVQEVQIVNLSHLDLLYASRITGQLLIDACEEEDGRPWMQAFGERYIEADALGWVERVLADERVEPDDGTDDLPEDTGDAVEEPTPNIGDGGLDACGCSSTPTPWMAGLLLPALFGLRRRL